jgi:hypothetical protein
MDAFQHVERFGLIVDSVERRDDVKGLRIASFVVMLCSFVCNVPSLVHAKAAP